MANFIGATIKNSTVEDHLYIAFDEVAKRRAILNGDSDIENVLLAPEETAQVQLVPNAERGLGVLTYGYIDSPGLTVEVEDGEVLYKL